jgi:hypothetical protein
MQGVLSQNQMSDFDLPPGNILLPKNYVQIDYSYKLNDISLEDVIPVYDDILKEYTQEDLNTMKTDSPERYAYFMRVKSYFDNLSDKVKVTFSYDELWYIYIYDKDLRLKLTSIR